MQEMEDMTNEELLKQVNTAISRVMIGGQSYQIGTRSLTRADLGMLRQLKNELTTAVNEESGELMDSTYVAMFDGR
ncbi:MAG: peptidylprolyl isomerase [Roseburia sp.]|nr:peptidylprolyl isomerase [Roseburia sp.]